MLLENEDKAKFIQYLESEIQSCQGMIEQYEKMGGSAMQTLIKRDKQMTAACIIILNHLRSGESLTINQPT